jgi:hypothetical protein
MDIYSLIKARQDETPSMTRGRLLKRKYPDQPDIVLASLVGGRYYFARLPGLAGQGDGQALAWKGQGAGSSQWGERPKDLTLIGLALEASLPRWRSQVEAAKAASELFALGLARAKRRMAVPTARGVALAKVLSRLSLCQPVTFLETEERLYQAAQSPDGNKALCVLSAAIKAAASEAKELLASKPCLVKAVACP